MMGLDRDRLIELVQVVVRNPLRAFLSALGVGWGLFMIIITVGAARGLENGVKADMGNDVANSMFAWTISTNIPYKGYQRGRWLELDIDDVKWLEANTQHLDLVCPEIQLGGWQGTNNVIHGKQSGAFDVSGAIARYQEVKPMNITSGRFLNQADLDAERKVCVIGSRVQDILFEFGENPLGETVQIQGVLFRVVGVYTPKGNDEDAQNEAESIYIPFTTFGKAFNTRAAGTHTVFAATRLTIRGGTRFMPTIMAPHAALQSVRHHPAVTVRTGYLITAQPAQSQRRITAPVQNQQALLDAVKSCLHCVDKCRR